MISLPEESAKSISIQEKRAALCRIGSREKEIRAEQVEEGQPDLAGLAEIVFSDIFEVQLADQTKVRGCFALWKQTRHILAIAFENHMRADLVVSTIDLIQHVIPGTIFHSDQGSQYGAEQTREVLLKKGFIRSMSRAGTPTDNGFAERVRRCAFILLVGEVQHH
jgi:transposase InsO family protein